MGIEYARMHLKKYGLENRIIEYNVSSATVELAALALNTETSRIAKNEIWNCSACCSLD